MVKLNGMALTACRAPLIAPVNARGHRQIAALIRALDGEKIDRVVSSPAGRAVAAATPIAAHFACPIRFDARSLNGASGH